MPQFVGHGIRRRRARHTVTWVPADPFVPYIAQVPLGLRLVSAALLIVTILVHGAAGVNVGLALATTIQWTRRAVAAVAGLALFVVFVVPLCMLTLNNGRPMDHGAGSLVLAVNSLLEPLVTRSSFHISDTLWSAFFWDVVATCFAIVVLWLTSRAWQRRLLGLEKSKTPFGIDAEDEPLAVESALIGDSSSAYE